MESRGGRFGPAWTAIVGLVLSRPGITPTEVGTV